ncbi:hypothetical protein BCR34DRAFT_593877 [Clohesyomyces aquaticus]|uniref:Uncharacterized protein n=1 Tax=Clohesyomyces aquaticus TaxID=1231657 RepID=A0A1Y1YEF7_9PLEO|nr:hypothetical protein BCR34DRAFT_593877 [Clohesyomyces aquaticus]
MALLLMARCHRLGLALHFTPPKKAKHVSAIPVPFLGQKRPRRACPAREVHCRAKGKRGGKAAGKENQEEGETGGKEGKDKGTARRRDTKRQSGSHSATKTVTRGPTREPVQRSTRSSEFRHRRALGIIMWKRFQGHGHGREKEKQIGNPVLLETTYDEDQLRHIPNISDAQNANYQFNAPASGYPSQTINTLSPPGPVRDYRASDVPTISSTYSQPSPEYRHDSKPTAVPPSGLSDISPPSSPEPQQQRRDPDQPRRFRSMRDVSPVDENRGQRARGQPASGAGGSNIPVLRKAPSQLRDGKETESTQKFWGGKVEPNSKVRWDEYSGEPSSEGKAASVTPAAYSMASLLPGTDRRPMGYQVSVSGGPSDPTRKNANSFSERVSRLANKSPQPVDTTLGKPREPWKGASGRVEIVEPLKNQPSSKPFQYARKPNLDTGVRSVSGGAKNKAGVSLSVPNTVKRVPVAADTQPVAEEDEGEDPHEDSIKPTVPLKVGRNSPPSTLASPVSPNHPGISQPKNPYAYPSPITPTNTQHPVGENNTSKPAVSQPLSSPFSTPPNTKIVRKSLEGTPGSTSSKDNGPQSRFSWTTYNTSTTYQQSPPPSPPPPVPTSALADTDVASSILNRRRPIGASDKLPTRKPISATTARPRTMISDPPSPRPSSTFSTATSNTHKALPRPPTEISAADHVDILEAQLEDLRLRRSNVHRLLTDLNNQAPANPLVTDFKRMRLVERRKKDFEDELAEIKREEHDVGLRLHRAWRKREKDDPNGSESAIWIRRVTRGIVIPSCLLLFLFPFLPTTSSPVYSESMFVETCRCGQVVSHSSLGPF